MVASMSAIDVRSPSSLTSPDGHGRDRSALNSLILPWSFLIIAVAPLCNFIIMTIITIIATGHSLASVVLSIVLLLLPSPAVSGCVTDWDCSLGGVCDAVTSSCHCDVWWTGAQ